VDARWDLLTVVISYISRNYKRRSDILQGLMGSLIGELLWPDKVERAGPFLVLEGLPVLIDCFAHALLLMRTGKGTTVKLTGILPSLSMLLESLCTNRERLEQVVPAEGFLRDQEVTALLEGLHQLFSLYYGQEISRYIEVLAMGFISYLGEYHDAEVAVSVLMSQPPTYVDQGDRGDSSTFLGRWLRTCKGGKLPAVDRQCIKVAREVCQTNEAALIRCDRIVQRAQAHMEGQVLRHCANSGCDADSSVGLSQLRKCSRCRGAYYCGYDCQQQHWEQHRRSCAKWK
jgi:hypothetical protein